MENIDCSKLSTREINVKIKKLVEQEKEILILNPQARHNLAIGILKSCKITFNGSVGYFCAGVCDNVNVLKNGNAGFPLFPTNPSSSHGGNNIRFPSLSLS